MANTQAPTAQLQTVDDALRVLEIAAERGHVVVKDVAAMLDCSRSSAYRIVRTLADRGWISQTAFGEYALGRRAVMLGVRTLNRAPLRDVARPVLEKLARATGETIVLSQRIGNDRVGIDQVESSHDIRMTAPLGKMYPLYAGGAGRAILIGLSDDERKRYLAVVKLARLTPNTIVDRRELKRSLEKGARAGYAFSIAERDPDAFAVAAPVFDRAGVLGSIAICGPASRFQIRRVRTLGPAARDGAQEISFMLGAVAAVRNGGTTVER